MTLGDRLVVPVIRQADALSLREVALAKTGSWLKLTRGQLTPNDWQGGTFTIAELGSGEVDAHFPIINDRQSAILGFGQVAPRCYPEGDEVRIGRFVTFTLTFDHTLMNGDYAARFLDGVIRGLIALGAQTSSDPDVPAITTQGCHDS
jgi:pyruvate dehydrogenase E2 component (dihydrolipoamide acetyltransferase)